jgi:outer membrane protein TolC
MTNEQLVKLYMRLSGANDSAALCVLMHLTRAEPDDAPGTAGNSLPRTNQPANPEVKAARVPTIIILLLLWVLPIQAATSVTTNSFLSKPLSLADAINVALEQNPNVLRAQTDLEATQGIIVQTRAIAIPKLRFTGDFNAVQQSDVDTVEFPASIVSPSSPFSSFSLGTDKSWQTQIRLVQSVYEGGRILSAFRVAKLMREQSLLNYQTTLANTVLDVQIAYDDVLLAVQQIIVQEASVELLTRELGDTTRRFDAGTVPRFNVLRAEVELANARPKLIRARNSLRIAKNNLANLLGINLPRETQEEIPLNLSGKLQAQPYQIELPKAIELGLEQRTELGSLRKAQALRQEDIVNAKAGYKPSMQIFGGYDARSSIFSSDLATQVHGWITGVQVTWDIFDGLRTQGRIKETKANLERASVELDDAQRRIELEVRTAYSNFKEADEVLKSQEKVLEEAEEALRLSRARSEAGTGTQLDVLSAQTALTEARTTQVRALHDFSVARARLDRAMGSNVPSVSAQAPN